MPCCAKMPTPKEIEMNMKSVSRVIWNRDPEFGIWNRNRVSDLAHPGNNVENQVAQTTKRTNMSSMPKGNDMWRIRLPRTQRERTCQAC